MEKSCFGKICINGMLWHSGLSAVAAHGYMTGIAPVGGLVETDDQVKFNMKTLFLLSSSRTFSY